MGLAVLLMFLAAAATPEYRSAKQKLDLIEKDRATPRSTVSFSHKEINDYARFRVDEVVPGAIRDPKVELRRDGAVGTALVDFAKLRASQGEAPGLLLGWLLRGERPIRVEVKLKSEAGRCQVDVERVEVSGIGVEGRSLDFLIENFLLPRYPDVKIGKPFELDHRVERIDVRPTSVFVRIGG
jgi:hypothetical protein